ncbi:MAG: hypothetical protein WAV26_08530 [Candidatus Deferrimicrobium sp.]
MAKTQGAIYLYFEAFEAGTPKAELRNEKVVNLLTRLEELVHITEYSTVRRL